MWLVAGISALAGVSVLTWLARGRKSRNRRSPSTSTSASSISGGSADRSDEDVSILSSKAVQRSLASGAPPTPWHLTRPDREAMAALAAYFARAIPAPTDDGRVSVKETAGHGGPQLELYVPVLSTKSPVAVLARSWDSANETLASSLYFFGAVNERLAAIVGKLGFERSDEPEDPGMTVFKNRRRFERQRAG